MLALTVDNDITAGKIVICFGLGMEETFCVTESRNIRNLCGPLALTVDSNTEVCCICLLQMWIV